MPKLPTKLKGILYVIIAAFGFSGMSLFVKLAGELPAIQKAFFRNFVALLFIFILMLQHHDSFRPKKGSLPALFGRAICGTVGLLCNFYALGTLNLSDANMLNKLSPFFAILFSVFLLRENQVPYSCWAWQWPLPGACLSSSPAFPTRLFCLPLRVWSAVWEPAWPIPLYASWGKSRKTAG